MKSFANAFIILASATLIALSSAHAGEKLVFSAIEGSTITLVQEPILREVYKQMGFEIEIRQYPAERALRMADAGVVDGEAGRLEVVRGKYRNLVMIPVPLHHVKVVAFAKDARIPLRGYESLKPYDVVTVIGYKHLEKKLEEHGIRHRLLPRYRQVLLTLDAGRNDIALLGLLDGLKAIRDLRLEGIVPLEPPLETLPMYHFVHKKHAALVPRITATLRELEEKGVLGKIENEVIGDLTKEW